MNLIYYPNAFLDKQVKVFDIENPPVDPKELKANMVEIMLNNNGIGLAANQVEFDGQVFVMGDKEDNATICINPQILQHTEEKVLDIEGCLSFVGIFVQVLRPKKITVKWQNIKGETLTNELDGMESKCFQHELDHLDGITFDTRVSKLKWNMAIKRRDKLNARSK